MSRAHAQARRIRLIALDLDGTLLRSDGTISARTRKALLQAEHAGVAVLTVTARPPRAVRRLAAHVDLRGTVICANGAMVYDVTHDLVLRQELLTAAVSEVLVRRLREALPGVAFMVEQGLHYGYEPSYAIAPEHRHDPDDPRMRRADALLLCREGVSKLVVQHAERDLEELLALVRLHAGSEASVTHSGAAFVEVAAANVSKALALAAFCRERGLTASEVIAFGDMPNDLPMLGWAGHGVAMANAHAEVRAAADEVTASNDQDGIALVLERLAISGYVSDGRPEGKVGAHG